GDARLVRNAIEQIQSSQTSEGATFSRAPSALQQYIPPFSLWWIGMVHDYRRYVDDAEFVREMLPGVRSVLAFYHRYQREDAALKMMPWWNYVDWVEKWPRGTPPRGADGGTAAIDLQLLLALQYAAEMERELGLPEMASVYQRRADLLKKTIHSKYWDRGRGLYADDAEHRHFSQHANILAVLAGLVEGERARELMGKVIEDGSLAPASIYFRYYLHRAMVRAGLGDRYLEMLGPWRRMMADGLTTWAERDFRTRSDCHAWGSSPNIELLRTVLGVDSAAPGFARVRIEPHLGRLQRASGIVPHPRGEVRVQLERAEDGALTGRIDLPAGITGEILWRGARSALRPGLNRVKLAPQARLVPPVIEKRVLRVKP
ncbi:MAG TPA: alpha-rhamnosidase, partial [Bryobacterales bacterium]|nr:alpha-rhamnosidase [Bryobacterales bacterium]